MSGGDELCNVYVHTLSGMDPVVMTVDQNVLVSHLVGQIYDGLPESVAKRCSISFNNGRHLGPAYRKLKLHDLNELQNLDGLLELRLNPGLCGGKGGFGSMLKSQGGRMSKRKGKKEESKDNWRTSVDGISVREVRRAKELASRMETVPKARQAAIEAKKAKLRAIIDREPTDLGSNTTGMALYGTASIVEESEALAAEVGETVSRVFGKRSTKSQAESSESPAATSSGPDKSSRSVKSLVGFFESESEEEE